jgi:GDPmannose 4,6-dehydratase
VASSWDFARQTWECNSTAILDCLEAIKRLKPDCRFYNAGSSEEFGNIVYEPQDENHPERPRSPYGASKAAARALIKVYRESYGLYAVQGWLFNHEGPRRGEEFVTRKITKGVARIYKAIDEGKSFEPLSLGNIDACRDWSDAEDMMDAVWRMMNQEKYNKILSEEYYEEWYELYNEYKNKRQITEWISKRIKDYVVGSGEKHTIREFVELAFASADIKGKWINNLTNPIETKFETPTHTLIKIDPKFYRPAEVENLRSNSELIRKELGWKPKTTFKELVEKMMLNDLTEIYK